MRKHPLFKFYPLFLLFPLFFYFFGELQVDALYICQAAVGLFCAFYLWKGRNYPHSVGLLLLSFGDVSYYVQVYRMHIGSDSFSFLMSTTFIYAAGKKLKIQYYL